MSAIDGPRYFTLAQRVGAYPGVLRAIYEARAQREEEERRGGISSGASSSHAPKEVTTSAAVAAADGWIEHVTEGE